MNSSKKRAKRSYKGTLRNPVVVKPVPQTWNRLTAPIPKADELAEYNARLIGQNPHIMMDLVSKMLELLELYQVSPFAHDKWFRLRSRSCHGTCSRIRDNKLVK